MRGKKINRCESCNNPLKHVQTNQWMCQQSPTKCELSTKIKFLDNPKDEEE